MADNWTRRQVLRRGGFAATGLAGLGLAGVAGYAWPHSTAQADARPDPSSPSSRSGTSGRTPSTSSTPSTPTSGAIDEFVTRSDLHPPVIKIAQTAAQTAAQTRAGQPPYIFIAPRGYVSKSIGESGLMIVDRAGNLVWFGSPIGGTPLNFTVQQYRGRPVLTWSAGYVNAAGVTYGTSYIADSSYRVICTVKAGNGAETDLHEFNLTPQGTALITAHRQLSANLTSVGGPARGSVMESVAQEVDVATGKVLFEWNSLDHVPLTESHQALVGGTASSPYDYFHINSVALASDGDLLISSRNTWTVYKVARSNGAIQWRLGGKKSDFAVGPGAGFSWQHDVRMPEPGLLTVFDNASSPPREPHSRALLLNVDTTSMRVTRRHVDGARGQEPSRAHGGSVPAA